MVSSIVPPPAADPLSARPHKATPLVAKLEALVVGIIVMGAVFFIILWVLLLVLDLSLLAVASTSEDPVLVLPNLVEKFLLENFLYVPAWFLGMANFGISLHHLVPWRSVDDTEALLKQWKSEGYSNRALALGLGGRHKYRATVAPDPVTTVDA